jgi:hypothetical protein
VTLVPLVASLMALFAPEKLSSTVRHLGGPNIPTADVEWAMDLPAGKCLIEWLASQLEGGLDNSAATGVHDGYSLDVQTSLEMIALEDDEIQMYGYVQVLSQ